MRIRELNEAENLGIISDNDSWRELKMYKCGSVSELYQYRDKTAEHYVILRGELGINGSVYGSGTVISYEPMERRNFFVLSDVSCLVVKDPELSGKDPLKMGDVTLDDYISPYRCNEKDSRRYNSICYKDITVVLQGPIDERYTHIAVESVRRFLPGAQIVISTWKGEKTADLTCDAVILNDDPGAPTYTKPNGKSHSDNRNRLLVSTQGGIRKVKTPYLLKMRTDCILSGDGIVRNYGKYPLKTGEFPLFKDKLVIGEQCNITRLKFQDCTRPYLFHVSDWFAFGLTEDFMTYYDDTDVEPDGEMTNWHYKNNLEVPEDDLMGRCASPRYNSEQYFFISALKRKYRVFYDDISDYSEGARIQSEKAIIDNFEILNIRDHEIINLKKQNKQPWDLKKDKSADYLTNMDYKELYMKYIRC